MASVDSVRGGMPQSLTQLIRPSKQSPLSPSTDDPKKMDFRLEYSMLEVNFKSYSSITNAQGGVTNHQESLYFKIESIRQSFTTSPTDDAKLKQTQLDGPKMLEYFSPENTASRIVAFALSGYGGDGSEESRKSWSDYILPAIEKGFNEAKDILGDLPDEIMAKIDATYDKVLELMNGFVTNAATPSAWTEPSIERKAMDDLKRNMPLAYESTFKGVEVKYERSASTGNGIVA